MIYPNPQAYPTPSPQRCPIKLVFGTMTEMKTAKMIGTDHVGIFAVPIGKCGLFLCVLIDSAPRRRKTQTDAPRTAVLLRRTPRSTTTYMSAGMVDSARNRQILSRV